MKVYARVLLILGCCSAFTSFIPPLAAKQGAPSSSQNTAPELNDSSSNDAYASTSMQSHRAEAAKYNYAPSSRTLHPLRVTRSSENIVNPDAVLHGGSSAIERKGSYITFDFGKEVGGIITLNFGAASDANQRVGLAFSESLTYAGPESDRSNGSSHGDGALIAKVAPQGSYTMPIDKLRGGFRYLTLFLDSAGFAHITGISLSFSPDPLREQPNDYPNYFYSNDDLLNKIWYSGAYTYQTNLARVDQGRAWPPVSDNWDNGHLIAEMGEVVLTDGAKRDRTIWPGDMGIAIPTGYVSLFDLEPSKNALQTLYNHQGDDGSLPYAGPPMNFGGSDTYHMWTLIGTHFYYLYSGDKAWLDTIWNHFKNGMDYITSKIGSDGLLEVTQTNDWARDNAGGKGIQANALLYGTLLRAAELARVEGDSALANRYEKTAAQLKRSINEQLWSLDVGAYRDKPTSKLFPQDGNSLALWFNVTDSREKAKSVSSYLSENWNGIGARGPEFTLGTGVPRISSFASSMEVLGHFEAGADLRALDLIRRMWGFMLADRNGPQSTIWEGFNSDGSFAYQDSYTSLSHAWGSGPTSALTFYTLGIKPRSPMGQTYSVIPHPGDLKHVEGSLTMAAGSVVSASYDVGDSCRSFSLTVDSKTHMGSSGTIGLPRFGANHVVSLDGTMIWDGSTFMGAPGIAAAYQDKDYIYFSSVEAGIRTFRFDDGKSCPRQEVWEFCSDEQGKCNINGKKRVRFGKNGQYRYGIFDKNIDCNATTFGDDPIANVMKSCQVSNEL